MIKLFLLGLLSNLGLLSILHSRAGEAGDGDGSSGDDGGKGGGDGAGKVNTFTQEDVNNIVARETKKVMEKYGDYGELVKFKQEQENLTKQREEQDLEKKQEYDKLKQGWETERQQYQDKINESKVALNNERINNALTNEVMKQNAFPEAAKLVREYATLTEDGKVVIKGFKNEQGIETDLPVDQGVKQFLKDRQYLVKANSQGGGGTPPGGDGGDGGQGNNSGDLADQMINAKNRGDMKEYKRIKEVIRAKHNTGAVLT